MHTAPNGKKYVGITAQAPSQRWRQGKGYRKNAYFYRAIQKYGWENINHVVLASGLTEEEANARETVLIDMLDLTNPEYGYNLHTGGLHHSVTEETRQKTSQSRMGKYTGKDNPFYGKTHSEETLALIRKRVEMYNPEGEWIKTFDSIRQAADFVDCDPSEIVKVCKGKRILSKGFQWKYEGSDKEIKAYKRKAHNQKKVHMIADSGEIIRTFDSLTAAGKEFGINSDKSIGDCCRGEQITAFGYRWQYA